VLGALLALTAASVAAQPAPPPGSEAPSASAAPPPSPAEPGESPDAVFRRGLELYDTGRYAAAAVLWEKLLDELGADKGWKLNYNLGLAYHAMGEATLAVERFESFLQRVAAEAQALPAEYEERRQDAASRILTIAREHGAVVLPAGPVAVHVRIDGGPPRPSGFVAYLRPGPHVIEIIGPSGIARLVEVSAAAGESITVDTRDRAAEPAAPTAAVPSPPSTAVPPPPATAPTGPAEPPSPAEFPTTLVLVGAGLTAASFVFPAVMWKLADDERAEAEALGPGHTGYAAAVDSFESARTSYELSYILPAALGAATAAVAIWGVVRVSSDATVHAAAAPTPTGGGQLWLGGTF